MWLCFNRSFLSIVEKDCHPHELLVRARRPGDIERIFPKAKVTESTNTDYRYRAKVPRAAIADALAKEVERISYSNFKDSVADKPLHDAYMGVWTVMSRMQPTRPYATAGRSNRGHGALL